MPISPLPESTVHLLGSGVTITNPCDLVKELVENAIDARAASIEVSISADSLKQIIVRDDGHGIALEDFESLGRRSHTSKLRSFDELQTRAGGETLGFRGEALASANSIASVSITTRTETDPVASLLRLKFGVGGIENLTKTSAPVGTTIQVSKLFEKLPVRRRVALKDGKKSIARIKDLLKAYALARPHLRLSLRVLEEIKGASRSTWSFSPTKAPTVHEAVLQIFGKDLASSCVKVSRQILPNKLVPLHVKAPPATILDAFIPMPQCEGKAIQGKGAHVSVDCRPISPHRGFGKKLVKIYTSYLAGALGNEGSSASLPNPFLRLNITCPPSSYDSNVTPLKDEVIFSDEHRVLESFERICQDIYQRGDTDGGGPVARLAPVGGFAQEKKSPAAASCNANKDANKSLEAASGAREETNEQPRQKLRMRTRSRVNMARTGSHTSVDTETDQTLPVYLLPLSPARDGAEPDPQARVNSTQTAPRYLLESIDHYLQPRGEKQFEIAADATATPGRDEGSEDEQISNGHRLWRRPLQPLLDSEINSQAGLEELDWSGPDLVPRHFSPQTPLPSPHSHRPANIGVPVRPHTLGVQRGPALTNQQRFERAQRRVLLDSSPLSREQLPSDIVSPPAATVLQGIRTPPSSDPRIDVRNPNPPFRSHGHLSLLRRSLGSLVGAASPRMPRSTDHLRLSWNNINERTRPREGSALPVDLRRLGSSEDLPYEVRGDVPETVTPPMARVGARHDSRDDRFGGFVNVSAGTKNMNSHGPGGRKGIVAGERLGARHIGHDGHGIQRQPSQESQPLASIEVDEHQEEESATLRGRHLTLTSKDGLAGRKRAIQSDEEEEAATHDIRANGNDDAIDHPSKRRRAQHSLNPPSIKGGGSSSAPRVVGRTRDEWKTQATWMGLEMSEREVGQWVRMLSPCEPYLLSGRLESGLPFQRMEEVREADSRLRRLVDAWAKRTKERDLEVEYTLQTAAKGKGAV